jgi:hypothetical protein
MERSYDLLIRADSARITGSQVYNDLLELNRQISLIPGPSQARLDRVASLGRTTADLHRKAQTGRTPPKLHPSPISQTSRVAVGRIRFSRLGHLRPELLGSPVGENRFPLVSRAPSIRGLRVARPKDGERITLNCCPLAKQPLKTMAPEALLVLARQIREGLNGINACICVRRTVKVHKDKIVITRAGA